MALEPPTALGRGKGRCSDDALLLASAFRHPPPPAPLPTIAVTMISLNVRQKTAAYGGARSRADQAKADAGGALDPFRRRECRPRVYVDTGAKKESGAQQQGLAAAGAGAAAGTPKGRGDQQQEEEEEEEGAAWVAREQLEALQLDRVRPWRRTFDLLPLSVHHSDHLVSLLPRPLGTKRVLPQADFLAGLPASEVLGLLSRRRLLGRHWASSYQAPGGMRSAMTLQQ